MSPVEEVQVIAASFEERSVWAQLVALGLGMGAYFVIAGRLLSAGIVEVTPYAGLFMAATIGMVVLMVVGHIVAAVCGRVEGRDERDRVIEWKAEHHSGWLMGVGVLTAVTGIVVKLPSVWIVHTLLLSLALSEVLSLVLRLVYYRRGV